MKNIFLMVITMLIAASCSKDSNKIVVDDFFYFRSNINGTTYQTNGYRYLDNTGHDGPHIWIRKTSGDSMYANVTVSAVSMATLNPATVGNISADFAIVKKGLNIEGEFSIDKANYIDNRLIVAGSDVMYIDTSYAFNFTITDSSSHVPHGAYAEGSYNFRVLKAGASVPVSGTFRLQYQP